MKIETLQVFCSTDETRSIRQPWEQGGYVFASDGTIMVRVAREQVEGDVPAPSPPEGSTFPQMFKYGSPRPDFPFNHATVAPDGWIPVPKITVPMMDCPDCDGKGSTHQCQRCKGNGWISCRCPHCDDEHTRDCPDCNGSGKSASDGPQIPCKECDGTGKIYDGTKGRVDIGCGPLGANYLRLIRDTFPDAEIERGTDPCAVRHWQGGDALGYLMPLCVS